MKLPLRAGLFRFALAPPRLPTAESRPPEQLVVRPDAMQDHGAPTNSINEQEVRSQVAFREAAPLFARLSETMLAERRWELLASDQDIEYILERFDVEFGVPTNRSVIALEPREND